MCIISGLQGDSRGFFQEPVELWECKERHHGIFWVWDNQDRLEANGGTISGEDCCKDFEKHLWFDLGKGIQRNHRSTFHNHFH